MKKSELRIDDTFTQEAYVGPEKLITTEVHQVIVLNHTNNRVKMEHMDAVYWLTPHGFSSLPESIAIELYDDPQFTILSMEEAQKYIRMSRERARKANEDIEEYNIKVRAHNIKFKEFSSKQKRTKKWRHVPGASPYAIWLELREKKAGKKRGLRSLKKQEK